MPWNNETKQTNLNSSILQVCLLIRCSLVAYRGGTFTSQQNTGSFGLFYYPIQLGFSLKLNSVTVVLQSNTLVLHQLSLPTSVKFLFKLYNPREESLFGN